MTIWDGKYYVLHDGGVIGPVTTQRDPANGSLGVKCNTSGEWYEQSDVAAGYETKIISVNNSADMPDFIYADEAIDKDYRGRPIRGEWWHVPSGNHKYRREPTDFEDAVFDHRMFGLFVAHLVAEDYPQSHISSFCVNWYDVSVTNFMIPNSIRGWEEYVAFVEEELKK